MEKGKSEFQVGKRRIMLQVSVHELEDADGEGQYLLVMKGAPERILQRCSTYWDGYKAHPIDDEFVQNFNDAYLQMGGMGERVLGMACPGVSSCTFTATVFQVSATTFSLRITSRLDSNSQQNLQIFRWKVFDFSVLYP